MCDADNFWSTFGSLPGYDLLMVEQHHVSNTWKPLAPRYPELIFIAKRQLRQRALYLFARRALFEAPLCF
jgi:hypothetical protein